MIFGVLSVVCAIAGGIFGFLQERADHNDTIEKASKEVLKHINKD